MRKLLCLAALLVSVLHGQTVPEMQTRLEKEVTALDQTRDEQFAVLRTYYLGALQTRMASLQSETDRQSLQEEIRRVQGDGSLRPAVLSSHAGVRHYQDILVQQLDRIEKPRAERLANLVERLQGFAQNQSAMLRHQGQAAAAAEWETWSAALPGLYLASGYGTGGKTRFFTMLENGQKPYLIILGTSTSEFPNARIDAPWVQCAPGDRANWPGVLSPQLRAIGELRLGGNTCAGATSTEFLDETGRFGNHRFRQLDWLVEQNPDAVIIDFSVGTDSVDRFNVTAAQSRANHEIILRALREKNPNVEIFLWSGAKSFNEGRRNYADDRSGLKREGSNDTQEDYARMLVELARASGPGVYIIDTFPIFAGILEKEGVRTYRTYFRDGNHTNQRGGEQVIVPEMMKVLEFGNP
ncbi:MAG: SGNH/GDSL hydrolase family protein [Verrucomicrobia bacterium]|nr:SGNH/GDSL hydrolase family protein [Verrucomicrobiota bacterium]MCH8514565.1 SGNH/GDSL hydrolase family protein [Kiritimatiellia bacterium]